MKTKIEVIKLVLKEEGKPNGGKQKKMKNSVQV